MAMSYVRASPPHCIPYVRWCAPNVVAIIRMLFYRCKVLNKFFAPVTREKLLAHIVTVKKRAKKINDNNAQKQTSNVCCTSPYGEDLSMSLSALIEMCLP